MPTIDTIGKTDEALLTSAAGSLPVSTGPTGYPLFDDNLYWDPTGRQQKLIGQATGLGGDRHNIQTSVGGDLVKVDLNGTTHRYLGPSSNPSGLYGSDHPIQTDAMRPNIPFTSSSSAHLNVSGTSWNNVHGIGKNDNSGVPIVPGRYIFRDAWEDNYEVAPGVFQCERHVGSVIDPTTGQEIRPYTAAVITSSTPYRSQVTHTTSHYKQIHEDGSLLVESRLSGDDYNFITPSFSSYQNLLLLLNQTAFGGNGLDSSFKLNGRTGRFDFQLGGVNKWSWIAHSDSNLYINNAADQNALYFDQSRQARFGGTIFGAPSGTLPTALRLANASSTGGAGDYSWKIGGPASGVDGDYLFYHTPSSKLLLRANGTGLGFFGVAPVARPTGELVAGLTGLGLMGSVTSLNLPGRITTPGRDGPIVTHADAATIPLDLTASDLHFVTLGGDRTLTISGATTGQRFTVKLIQDGTGGWNPTWWSGITWYTSDGLKPTPSPGAGKGTYVQFVTTGSGTYDGFPIPGQA